MAPLLPCQCSRMRTRLSDVCPNPLLGSLGVGDHINNHMKKQENVKIFPSCHPSYTPTVEIPSAFVALVSTIVIKCCPPQEEGKHSRSSLPAPMPQECPRSRPLYHNTGRDLQLWSFSPLASFIPHNLVSQPQLVLCHIVRLIPSPVKSQIV